MSESKPTRRSTRRHKPETNKPLGRPARPDDQQSGIMPILGVLLVLAILYALATAII